MNATESELIDACQELGGIASSNGHFTAGLARIIEATGKAIPDMTVSELLHLAREYNETFNRIHS
jgi:hypothetical protein